MKGQPGIKYNLLARPYILSPSGVMTLLMGLNGNLLALSMNYNLTSTTTPLQLAETNFGYQ